MLIIYALNFIDLIFVTKSNLNNTLFRNNCQIYMDFDSFLAKSFYGRVDGTGAAQSGRGASGGPSRAQGLPYTRIT